MECTGDPRRTVRTAVSSVVVRSLTHTATRAVAVVVAGAALVAGGVAAAKAVPAGTPSAGPPGSTWVLAALPDSIGAANRAW